MAALHDPLIVPLHCPESATPMVIEPYCDEICELNSFVIPLWRRFVPAAHPSALPAPCAFARLLPGLKGSPQPDSVRAPSLEFSPRSSVGLLASKIPGLWPVTPIVQPPLSKTDRFWNDLVPRTVNLK